MKISVRGLLREGIIPCPSRERNNVSIRIESSLLTRRSPGWKRFDSSNVSLTLLNCATCSTGRLIETKKFPPDISRTLEDYPFSVRVGRVCVWGTTNGRLIVYETTAINKGRRSSSPWAHNNRGTCASDQSTNAQDPHRSAYEWSCFDRARCYLNRIYHISAAKAPAFECCSTG